MSGLGFGGHGGGRAVGVGGASNDTAMDDQHKLAKHQQLLEELVFQLEEAKMERATMLVMKANYLLS